MANITIRGLVKSYIKGTNVIDGFDLDVAEGEFVSLLGPSGCGKTTTLRCVAGLEHPDGGEIRIGDRTVFSSASNQFVPPNKRRVGLVFQNYALWPHLSVSSNVEYPLKVRRVPRAARRAEVAQAIESVGLTAQSRRPATMLSGGQQQRVALARAMVGSPSLLLFDEPLSNLDAQLRAAMRKEIRRVHNRAGVASLFVTHDQLEAIELSDRVLVMRGGQIEQMGAPRELYRAPATRFVAEFLGYENFIAGTVQSVTDDVTTVFSDGGDSIRCRTRRSASVGDRVWLTLRSTDVRLHDELPRDEPNAFAARITAFVFSGDTLRYETDLSGAPIRAVLPDDRNAPALNLTPGPQNRSAAVSLPPESLILLPNDEATGVAAPARHGSVPEAASSHV